MLTALCWKLSLFHAVLHRGSITARKESGTGQEFSALGPTERGCKYIGDFIYMD